MRSRLYGMPAKISHPYIRHYADRAKARRKSVNPHTTGRIRLLNVAGQGRMLSLSGRQIDYLMSKGYCELNISGKRVLFCLTNFVIRGTDYYRITAIDLNRKRLIGILDFKIDSNGSAECEVKYDDSHMKLPHSVALELDKNGFGSSEIAGLYNDVSGEESAFFVVEGYREKGAFGCRGLAKFIFTTAMAIQRKFGATVFFVKGVGGIYDGTRRKLEEYYSTNYGAELVAGKVGTMRIDLSKSFFSNPLPAPVVTTSTEPAELMPSECYY